MKQKQKIKVQYQLNDRTGSFVLFPNHVRNDAQLRNYLF